MDDEAQRKRLAERVTKGLEKAFGVAGARAFEKRMQNFWVECEKHEKLRDEYKAATNFEGSFELYVWVKENAPEFLQE